MNAVEQFVNDLAVQQDFFWFLAILAWSGVVLHAFVARQNPAARMPAWLVTAGAAQIIHAGFALALMIFPMREGLGYWLGTDVMLVVPLAVTVAALGWGAWGRIGRWASSLLCLVLLWLRYLAPDWYASRTDAVSRVVYLSDLAPVWSAALTTLLSGIAGWYLLRRQTVEHRGGKVPRGVRAGIALLAILPLASPVGPLAFWLHEAQIWNRLPRLGLPCSIIAMLAGLAWLWSSLAPRPAFDRTERVRAEELRWFGVALASWLVVGWGLTALSGRMARVMFEQSLLAQARVGAKLINPEDVAACLGPEFTFGAPVASNMGDGRRDLYAVSPYLTSRRVAPVRLQLEQVRRAIASTLYAHVVTIRAGYVMSVIFDDHMQRRTRFVPIHREARLDDWVAWAERRESVGPIFLWGQHVGAWVPLTRADGRMLGWLAVNVPIEAWLAAQAQSRVEALLLTAAGVALGVLTFGLRLRGREKSKAVEVAKAAQETARMQNMFLAKVSHELRTPVQNIVGYAQLLRPSIGDARARERIGAVQAQGKLLVRLVNDLLDLSASHSGAFRLESRPASVCAVLEECAEAMRPAAEARGLVLHTDFTVEKSRVFSFDPERLRQVATNLISNAIKFTSTGWVKVSLREYGDARFQLTVTDTGPGISIEDQAKLFQPFERLNASSESEGSGLGLALSRMICLAMNGRLEVQSDGIAGTTFTALFAAPLASTLVGRPASGPGPETILDQRILIADDNRLVRQLFRTWLENAGASVCEARDGWEARQRVEREVPDVIVLDLSMPGLGGLELTRWLRSDGHDPARLRIIGVSAHAGQAEREQALAAGMDRFLIKPVEPAELIAAIAGATPRPYPQRPHGDSAADLRDRLLGIFVSEAPRLIRETEEAASTRDWPRLAKVAHELGNAAFALQDTQLAEVSAAMEQAARSARPDPRALPAEVVAAIRRLALPNLAPAIPTGANPTQLDK